MNTKTNTRQTLSVGKRRATQPRQKDWSHQKWLQGLIGRDAKFIYTDGEFDRGTVVNVDQFTILVTIGGEETLIFKSALSSIVPAEKAA